MAQERQATRGTEADVAATEATPTSTPGVVAVQALVMQEGARVPEPAKVLDILDGHRGERDAILAYLHKTLGNGYVQRVLETAEPLRFSKERKELAAGDPSATHGGYFLASAEEQAMRWRSNDEAFTGKVDKAGLDSTYRVDADDAVHARYSTKDKVGTLDWTRAGETQAKLTYDKQGVDGIYHLDDDDALRARYTSKDKVATLGWERDGKTQGELFGSYKSGSEWETGARRPWELDGGTLTTGVRHRVAGGVARDELTGDYKAADGSMSLYGSAGVGAGQPVGSLGGMYKLTPASSVAGSLTRDPYSTTLAGSYRDARSSLEGTVTVPDQGAVTGSVIGRHQLDPQTSLYASAARTADRTALEIGGSHKPMPEMDLNGKLRQEWIDGQGSQTSLSLSERYRSGGLIHGVDLDAGTGVRDYATLTGTAEMQLAQNVYGGAWTSMTMEGGHAATAQLGGSLTWTPTDKAALTLAGLVDDSGMLETRLQLDVFKKKIDSLSALSQHKKDALVSLFLSYSTQAGSHRLDDRFGAAQHALDVGGGDEQRVMAGIRIKF